MSTSRTDSNVLMMPKLTLNVGGLGFNQPSSKLVKIEGDWVFDSGILNSESFMFRVKKKHRSMFKQVGRFAFFCTSHTTMYGGFPISDGQSKALSDPQLQGPIFVMD